jgi:GNAT superfamily N-acetyltransferase
MVETRAQDPGPAGERAGITYRRYNFHREDYLPLIRLKEAVYGAPVERSRWEWQYLRSPFSTDIQVFVAECGTELAGATTRLPFDLRQGEKTVRAYFSIDSMVHPNYRRRGIMKSLYQRTADVMPLLYSKGTNPGMYDLLIEFGYKVVQPNTYLVKHLSPWKLGLHRCNLYTPSAVFSDRGARKDGFEPVHTFGQEFDTFRARVAGAFPGIVEKDSPYMNWRYVDIPHKKYHLYYKVKEGRIVCALVIRTGGYACWIVDLIWDPGAGEEPGATIRAWARAMKEQGYLKMICWGTYRPFREALIRNGFVDRGTSPRFSVFAPPETVEAYADAGNLHFVDGDGDSEYLS